jgi:hypothetical protein
LRKAVELEGIAKLKNLSALIGANKWCTGQNVGGIFYYELDLILYRLLGTKAAK